MTHFDDTPVCPMSPIHLPQHLSASASAPGKLILFGEHAVVYGQPAVAVSLADLRIQVDVALRNDGIADINMPDLKPDPLRFCVSAITLRRDNVKCPPTLNDSEILKTLLRLCMPESKEDCITALSPVIYLLNILLPSILSSDYGISLHVKSNQLPSGAGLGSSAAFGVALSAALYKLSLMLDSSSLLNMKNAEQQFLRPSLFHLDQINLFSFYSEILIHGTPSGLDNTVCTYGGAVFYKKNVEDSMVSMEKISIPQLSMIITNTNIARSTKTLVAGVRKMKDNLPSVVEGIMTAIGAIATEFRDMTSKTELAKLDEHLISTLIRMNQNLLCSLGVSHKCIDALCIRTANLYNDLRCATKLTGAGGGGCVFTFVERIDGESLQDFTSRLNNLRNVMINDNGEGGNFSSLVSDVGGCGVLWR